VFSLDPGTDTETVLHSFCGPKNCTDGRYPYAGLVDVNGTLYGTTSAGGVNGSGTVFSVDPGTGAETVLYSFCSETNCADGASPWTSLLEANGTLYGTTSAGGANSGGTVFSLDPGTGTETVLYSFCSQTNCADGASPYASLIDVNGTLYGTTYFGGITGCYLGGCGTVFSFDPGTGTETVLYSFCSQTDCTDGDQPNGGLVDVNGILYGTTSRGGAACNSGYNCGTVFSVDPQAGTETVLHTFCPNCGDGSTPMASLIAVQGILYGTTEFGGAVSIEGGTVFSLDPGTGTETVLYSLPCPGRSCKHGDSPVAGLLDLNGTLYGTAKFSGVYRRLSGGVVFSLKAR